VYKFYDFRVRITYELHSWTLDSLAFASQGYAKNYISKIVKRSAADDARIGYIKEASALVGSCEGLLRGKEELTGSNAAKEASDRTKKAQALIAKFLAESGVEDERVEAFVAAH